jgi:hypothetical protein
MIISDGFSCRSQIAHFCAGRKAMHLAEALNLDPLAPPSSPGSRAI